MTAYVDADQEDVRDVVADRELAMDLEEDIPVMVMPLSRESYAIKQEMREWKGRLDS